MRNVILLTDPKGKHWAYGSILAMLEDPENPVNVSERYFHSLHQAGWPVSYAGCTIEKLPYLNANEARAKKRVE